LAPRSYDERPHKATFEVDIQLITLLLDGQSAAIDLQEG
jgi:hypothetical protein